MKLQMLISGLEKDPVQLLSQMNIECDAVLVNQCDKDETEVIHRGALTWNVLHRNERGVGKSRNAALDKAEREYILFSDEDVVYFPGYAEEVVKEFERNPQADVILFNVKVCTERRTYWNESRKRLHWYNCGRFPAYSIAAKRGAVVNKGIRYSELFGGGAKYSNGEDSLFLKDCADAGLKLYTSTVCIGEEVPRESTWFHGFNEKFFFDRGVLFYFLYKKLAILWALRFVLTKREMLQGEIKGREAFKLLRQGIKKGKEEYLRTKARRS